MGYNRFDDIEMRAYASTTGYRNVRPEAIFSKQVAPYTMPKNFSVRESCVSEKNPHPTPVILGLDVSGTMGRFAGEIAQKHLPELMSSIIELGLVADPHVLSLAIGDVRAGDSFPLLSTHFEPDVKMIKQIRELMNEGGGGGNDQESYDLAWLFAIHKTSCDAIRNERQGFIITFGDEPPPNVPLNQDEWKKVFGDTVEYHRYNSMQEIVATAADLGWEIFHVVIEQGAYMQRHGGPETVYEAWNALLGSSRVIHLRNSAKIKDACSKVFDLATGRASVEEVILNEEDRYMFCGLLNG